MGEADGLHGYRYESFSRHRVSLQVTADTDFRGGAARYRFIATPPPAPARERDWPHPGLTLAVDGLVCPVLLTPGGLPLRRVENDAGGLRGDQVRELLAQEGRVAGHLGCGEGSAFGEAAVGALEAAPVGDDEALGVTAGAVGVGRQPGAGPSQRAPQQRERAAVRRCREGGVSAPRCAGA